MQEWLLENPARTGSEEDPKTTRDIDDYNDADREYLGAPFDLDLYEKTFGEKWKEPVELPVFEFKI